MFGRSEFCWQMTLATDSTRLRAGDQLQGMRIVAIAAGDTRLIHAALHERAVDIDLVLYLTVIEIQRRIQYRRSMGLCKRHAVLILATDHAAPRMAATTGFRLLRLSHCQLAAFGDTGLYIHLPD